MIFRGVSIALLPFWRFDAKGGEVVLLGCLRDLHGLSREPVLAFDLFLLANSLVYWCACGFMSVNLCVLMDHVVCYV